jgi:lysozyme family protein
MAKIDELIPFFLFFECGFDKSYLKLPLPQLFKQAKKSGYSNDKDDDGGPTMCGVTLATFTACRQKQGITRTTVTNLINISFEDWRTIMKRMYWDRWHADRITCQSLANILVDWTWISGTPGITIPQRILGVTADGAVGPVTLTALESRDAETLFNQIHAARINFAEDIVRRKPRKKKFLKGWKRRINSITFSGLRYDVE